MESRNHRISESLNLKITESQNSWGAGTPGAGDTGTCPGGFGMTPGPPRAAVPGLCHPPWKALPQVEVELAVF